jgi:hypothetical protein
VHTHITRLCRRRTSKKRRKQRQLLLLRRAPEGSSVLFRWLFRSCAAWLLWEWVRVSECVSCSASAVSRGFKLKPPATPAYSPAD